MQEIEGKGARSFLIRRNYFEGIVSLVEKRWITSQHIFVVAGATGGAAAGGALRVARACGARWRGRKQKGARAFAPMVFTKMREGPYLCILSSVLRVQDRKGMYRTRCKSSSVVYVPIFYLVA